ncbi:MAG: hypothetical protein IJG45_07980 [Oscillospiraceae bacterium]|nr:hypothetical protein [Oscillospiraceae bacterium]
MVELKLLVERLLSNAGLHCLLEYPFAPLPRLETPMVAVGLDSQRLLKTAFGDFFGYLAGRVCTGFLEESVIRLDVFSPYMSGGAPCRTTMNEALLAALNGVVNHSLTDVKVGDIHYDPKVDCIRCSALLTFRAHLFQYAET